MKKPCVKLLAAALLVLFVPVGVNAKETNNAKEKIKIGTYRPSLMRICDGDDNPYPGGDESILRGLKANSGNKKIYAHESSIALKLGVTPQEVSAKFSSNIEEDFKNGSTERMISRLSDKELADIAHIYGLANSNADNALLATLAKRLSDKSLLRVAATFGAEQTRQAVVRYAAPDVKTSFLKNVAFVTSVPSSITYSPMAGPAPNLDMTLRQIYLEFRLETVGGLSASASLSETAMYADGPLGWSAGAGTAVGYGINYLIETYDPSLSDAIGGTIAGMWDASKNAGSEVQKGHYQSAFDDLFGYPVSNSSDPWGDGDLADPMMDYYESGGGC